MEYVYASLILYHAGREITEESVRRILEAAGVQVDEVRLKALVASLKEVNIEEAIKTAAMPVVAAPATTAAATAPAPSAEGKKEEEKKEEKKEEAPEESIEEGLSGLFGF
ncbi:50S ribosomal protein P1 [Infirmifilum sp. SLHALR2]|nr:MAG: 50S ribosomal protein P1 [Thermofilum sp. NZ13]